jgi:hypothetical protein
VLNLLSNFLKIFETKKEIREGDYMFLGRGVFYTTAENAMVYFLYFVILCKIQISLPLRDGF